MRYQTSILLLAVLVIAIAFVAGCTMPSASQGTPAPAATAQPAAAQPQQQFTPQYTSAPASPSGASSSGGGVETTINVHQNDYACLDVQKAMNVDYLYMDEKYTIQVSPPADGGVNVNALFIDTQDRTKLTSVPPKWDSVKKAWIYDGLVPLLQFNDITMPVQKTVTIKDQGQYYLCVDDRKESGSVDVTYKIPVKFTPV